jgi:hypothetical protein
MNAELSRRRVLLAGGIGAAGWASGVSAQPASNPGSTPWPSFPRHDPKIIAEVVGKSHFDEARVRALIGLHPSLVNAAWDWGFGDWETPLGAASHVGRREIAEFLIASGARIDIFAASMLGYTDVVRAFVTANPGVQRLLGPHGIPLLAHAKAGGDKAKSTFDYLASLGDAGNGLEAKPITEEDRAKYLGTYQHGSGEHGRFEIKLNSRGALTFVPADGGQQMIHSLGDHEFYPSGVFNTRFKFDLNTSPVSVTISSGPSTLVSKRSAL